MFEKLYDRLIAGEEKLSVVGLGYVGMPLAIAFAEKIKVIGLDIDERRIEAYRSGVDLTNEVGDSAVSNTSVQFTSDPSRLREARFHVVAVPTPVDANKAPDLTPVKSASRIVGHNLVPGSIVIFESTVYPGVTEDVCVPILEAESGLRCGEDFKVGYSPERINPGDRVHTLRTIPKVVSGTDEVTVEVARHIYDLVVEAGTHPVSSIRTAEAIKVAENSQRDINIAFMNELAMVFDRMGIDTNEVVDGMNTKWNALGFRPGLVGGHCISVDPYYFTYEAERLGYHSQIVASGRKVNDGMGEFVADAAIRQIILSGKAPKGTRVAVLGITFKEDCPDTRNTKVVDVIRRLEEYGVDICVVDPWASEDSVRAEYGIELLPLERVRDAECVIIAVAHTDFRELGRPELNALFAEDSHEQKILLDVKGVVSPEVISGSGYRYWRL
ncbi:nucleotide sugar dehydrogenase [Actinomycetaceae bacterium L2_0104]